MSISGTIRAGAAYVEVTAQTSKLQRGLANAQAQLQQFGRSCTAIGRDMLMLSGAFAVPMAMAVKGFAEFDDQMRLVRAVTKATKQAYEDKIVRYRELGIDFYEVERVILLRIVDTKWIDHIDAMDQLRRGIGLRAYGNQDPVIAYKKEGYDMFDFMEERIKEDTAFTLLKVELQKVPEVKSQMPETTTNEDGKRVPVKAGKKVGPNDPCPCGSGLKYKKCCGK